MAEIPEKPNMGQLWAPKREVYRIISIYKTSSNNLLCMIVPSWVKSAREAENTARWVPWDELRLIMEQQGE